MKEFKPGYYLLQNQLLYVAQKKTDIYCPKGRAYYYHATGILITPMNSYYEPRSVDNLTKLEKIIYNAKTN